MEDLNNYRSKRIYSGKAARKYPTCAPTGAAYKVYYENIQAGCFQAKGKISVLELGCGTGRYFHLLDNVQKLVGIDISEDMLKVAHENLKIIPELQINAQLINSSIENFNIDEKFDFIYSIGTLGEYCEFNGRLLNKIITYLKPNGFFFFTLVDSESYIPSDYIGVKKKVARFVLKLLPYSIRIKVDAKVLITDDWKSLFLNRKQVENILFSVKFPIKWELTKAKDTKHIHHICKIWLANG